RWEDIKDLQLINSLPGEFPYLRGTKKNTNAWLVRQDLEVKDIKEANKKALFLLERGVEYLYFKFNEYDLYDQLMDDLLKGIYDLEKKNIKETNKKDLLLLEKGVESLSFKINEKDLNDQLMDALLKGIDAETVELNFSTCQGHIVELAKLVVAYFQKKNYDVK